MTMNFTAVLNPIIKRGMERARRRPSVITWRLLEQFPYGSKGRNTQHFTIDFEFNQNQSSVKMLQSLTYLHSVPAESSSYQPPQLELVKIKKKI